MPVYKGTTEIASGKLYKAATNIENGYKGTNSFYINEVTVSFATPTGQSLTYTAPSPASSTGAPGTAFPSTTFTITGGASNILSGTATVTGLPSGLTYSQSYNNSNMGNTLTITIGGNYPTASSLNTALTISGLTNLVAFTGSFSNTYSSSNLGVFAGTAGTLSAQTGLSDTFTYTNNTGSSLTVTINAFGHGLDTGFGNPNYITVDGTIRKYSEATATFTIGTGSGSLGISATQLRWTSPNNGSAWSSSIGFGITGSGVNSTYDFYTAYGS